VPLPGVLHCAAVGRHEGYFERFSPFSLPHALYPITLPSFLIGALQSTHPPFLPGSPLRENQVRRVSLTFSRSNSSVT